MPALSAKRQVTIPKALCDRLGVAPGDDLDILEYGGKITLLKKRMGASAGILGYIKGDASVSDEDSRQAALAERLGGVL